jgi:hypothetical protein
MRFKRFLMKILFCAILALIAASAPSAKAADAPAAHVRVDPALSAKEEQYKKIFAALTKEQQAALRALDQKNTELNEPNFAIIEQTAKFSACAKKNPALVRKYGDALLTFKYRKLDEYAGLRAKFFTEMAKIAFIDKKLLDGHLTMQANMQAQKIGGKARQQQEVKPEECAKLTAELDHIPPYFEASNSAFRAAETRNPATDKIKSCSMTLLHNQTGGGQQSIALHVIPDSAETGTFEFSAKIFLSPKKTVPVESLWIDFGTLNTRFMARTRSANGQMELGVLPAASIVPALRDMAKMPTTVSIKSAGRAEANVFRTRLPAKPELDKFSRCVAEAQPKLIAPLIDAGFPVLTSPEEIAAAEAAKKAVSDPYYKASQLSPSPKNPGICMLQVGPYKEQDMSVSAVMVVGVQRMRNNAVAMINGFWVIGEKSARRIDISKARLSTTDPDGRDVDTDDFSPHLKPGQRYEIYYPAEENGDLMPGIIKNGIKLEAESKQLPHPLSHSFPPPLPETMASFNDCLLRLNKSLKSEHARRR